MLPGRQNGFNGDLRMWNKKTHDMVKDARLSSPSKFFVVNDLKGINPRDNDGALMKSSDSKIKNQIRLAMEVNCRVTMD